MEIMIVMATIAILVSIALPAYQEYSIRTKITESLTVSVAAKSALNEFCQVEPLRPPTNNLIGYSFAPSQYVASVIVGGSCNAPTITMTTRGTGALLSPVLVMEAQFTNEDGRFMWTCSALTGTETLVPTACRTS